MAEPWRDSNYAYRKQITVQDANIDSDLTDFPCLIAWDDDTDINTGVCQADLDDIRFYDGSGNLLKYEVEWYEIDGTDSSARIWVKKPSLYASPSGTDNDVWLYYGYASATNGEDAANVWDANFKCVLHLSEASGTLYDSTSNSNDFTAYNSPTYAQTGKVGNAMLFVRANSEYLSRAAAVVTVAPLTLEAWFNCSDVANAQSVVAIGDTAGAVDYWDLRCQGNATGDPLRMWAYDATGTYAATTSAYSASTWHYGVGREQSSSSRDVLLDNASKGTNTTLKTPDSADNTSIGALKLSALYIPFDGYIDEVRISDVARSDAWVKFTYHNINEADNELTWGAEETVAAGGRKAAIIGGGVALGV